MKDPMKKAAEGMGAHLFDLARRAGKGLQRGGEYVADALNSRPVRATGEAIGEGLGRLGGALEGMGGSTSARLFWLLAISLRYSGTAG